MTAYHVATHRVRVAVLHPPSTAIPVEADAQLPHSRSPFRCRPLVDPASAVVGAKEHMHAAPHPRPRHAMETAWAACCCTGKALLRTCACRVEGIRLLSIRCFCAVAAVHTAVHGAAWRWLVLWLVLWLALWLCDSRRTDGEARHRSTARPRAPPASCSHASAPSAHNVPSHRRPAQPQSPMGSTNTDSLANRDAPVPVVQIHPADDATPRAPHARTPSAEHRLAHRLSASKLKDKLESLGEHASRPSSSRMGDRMINL